MPSLFERQRRVLMTASMMSIHGKIQREGEVVHLVAQRLFEFLADLASLGERDSVFPVPHERGDQVKHGDAHAALVQHPSRRGSGSLR